MEVAFKGEGGKSVTMSSDFSWFAVIVPKDKQSAKAGTEVILACIDQPSNRMSALNARVSLKIDGDKAFRDSSRQVDFREAATMITTSQSNKLVVANSDQALLIPVTSEIMKHFIPAPTEPVPAEPTSVGPVPAPAA